MRGQWSSFYPLTPLSTHGCIPCHIPARLLGESYVQGLGEEGIPVKLCPLIYKWGSRGTFLGEPRQEFTGKLLKLGSHERILIARGRPVSRQVHINRALFTQRLQRAMSNRMSHDVYTRGIHAEQWLTLNWNLQGSRRTFLGQPIKSSDSDSTLKLLNPYNSFY